MFQTFRYGKTKSSIWHWSHSNIYSAASLPPSSPVSASAFHSPSFKKSKRNNRIFATWKVITAERNGVVVFSFVSPFKKQRMKFQFDYEQRWLLARLNLHPSPCEMAHFRFCWFGFFHNYNLPLTLTNRMILPGGSFLP